MTPECYSRITQVLNQRQPDLTVITDEVHKGRNISAIMRTCDAVGIDTMHVVRPKAGYRHYNGTALGSHKWVDTELHDSVSDAITGLQEQSFQVVVAHLSDSAFDYQDIDYTKATALLVGTENHGPSEDALALADAQITIPMVGMVGSYNVSVASAIILSEAYRQRKLAGLYDLVRLPKEVYQNRLFRWCHPVVADYCQKSNLAYPPLDEEGEIVDAPDWYRQARLTMANDRVTHNKENSNKASINSAEEAWNKYEV
ncbi:MAG: tRNA (guanosine(18)-2'-O)-methyltransferase TrmH [Cellvibrionaceae bacterium]